MAKGKEVKAVRRRTRLKSVQDVQRALARLYRDLLHGDIEVSVAGRAAFILNILLKAMEQGDFELRIQALEKALTSK